MKEITLNVDGMHCEGCENRIKKALNNKGIEDVKASHHDGNVIIKTNNDINEIKEIIEDLGFKIKD